MAVSLVMAIVGALVALIYTVQTYDIRADKAAEC